MAAQSQGHYATRLTITLFALVPYILVASGAALYRDQIAQDLQASRGALSVIEGLSTAGYAFGALLAGDLVNRFPQKRLFLTGESLFVIGWLLIAVAGGTITYGAGRVLAGFATGTLLVTSLPPVVRQFPPSRLPLTAAFVNLGLFGAVAAGPLLGGAVAGGHAWRLLYLGFCAVGVVSFVVALVILPTQDPPNPDLPLDRAGLTLGFAGTVLPFWASGELQSHGFGTLIVAIPLGIGLACFVALLLVEYHKREALAPVTRMWSTFPVVGTLIAMIGGGAFVTFVLLTMQLMRQVDGSTPLATGLAFWPQVIGALITAAALGVVFRTRFLPVLALFGMLVLVAGGVLLAVLDIRSGQPTQLLAVGLLGLGAGATVSPGLFLAGMALPAQLLGRIFALIELVRSVADFIMAPVLLHVAKIASADSSLGAGGIHQALWITLAITLGGMVLAVLLYALGGSGLPRPDIHAWLEQNQTAVHSPALLQRLRRGA